MMKQKLGAVAFFLGLMTMMGCAGADLPADATVRQWVSLCGIAFTGGMLAQLGVWMIKDEV
jgi:hypothetical protein